MAKTKINAAQIALLDEFEDTADPAMKQRKKKKRRAGDEGSYVCPTCGEQIVIPLDRSGGTEQRYGEDCPVCCNPNMIHVEFFDAEVPRVWAEAE